MTRTHTADFEAVGFSQDPTPGIPDMLRDKVAATYQSIGDDADAAAKALTGSEIDAGTGAAMDGLRKKIGTEYAAKLHTAVTSFHTAAEAYRDYARSLEEAQGDLDRAMDQAQPVAALAAQKAPKPAADAAADEVVAASQKQADISQAQTTLTAAHGIAQSAQTVRDNAANKLVATLQDVDTVPAPNPFSVIADFFQHNPIVQAIIGIVIGIIAVFFPVVGFLLGAAFFALTFASKTVKDGVFDGGAFFVGLFSLVTGGLGILGIASKTVGGLFEKAGGGIVKLFNKVPGNAKGGLTNIASKIHHNKFLDAGAKTAGEFAENVGVNAVGAGIDKADPNIHQDVNAGALFAGAAGGAAGGLGSASLLGAGKKLFGKSGSATGQPGAPATPAASGKPTTPAAGSTTPAAGGPTATPSAASNAPSASGQANTSPGSAQAATPTGSAQAATPTGGGQPSTPTAGSTTPTAGSTTPAAGSNAPAGGPAATPAAASNAPSASGQANTSPGSAQAATPTGGGQPSTPAAGSNTSPASGQAATPTGGGQPSTPAAGSTTPAAGAGGGGGASGGSSTNVTTGTRAPVPPAGGGGTVSAGGTGGSGGATSPGPGSGAAGAFVPKDLLKNPAPAREQAADIFENEAKAFTDAAVRSEAATGGNDQFKSNVSDNFTGSFAELGSADLKDKGFFGQIAKGASGTPKNRK